MATGDEVITFWKVKVGRGCMHSTERPSSWVFSVLSQEIGCEERLRNDLFCVGWDVKP